MQFLRSQSVFSIMLLLTLVHVARSETSEIVSVLQLMPEPIHGMSSEPPEASETYDVRRRTLAALLQLHVNREDVMTETCESAELDPQRWISQSFRVSTPDRTQLITVAATVADEDVGSAVKLMDRLVETFIVDTEPDRRRDEVARLERLRNQFRESYNDITKKSDEVSMLVGQLGILDKETLTAEQRIRLQEASTFKQEHERLKRELDNVQHQLALVHSRATVVETAEASEVHIEDELERDPKYHDLRVQIREFKAHVDSLSKSIRPDSDALAPLQQELEFIEQQLLSRRNKLMPNIVARSNSQRAASAEDKAEISMLQTNVQSLERQVRTAANHYETKLAAVREFGEFSADLDARMEEMTHLRATAQRIRGEIQQLELQLDGDSSSLRVVQSARRMRAVLSR